MVRARAKRDSWDGKENLYVMGHEYDIDPKAPGAVHFDFPKDEKVEKKEPEKEELKKEPGKPPKP